MLLTRSGFRTTVTSSCPCKSVNAPTRWRRRFEGAEMTTSRSRAELNDLLGSRKVEHVAVLGANGAMGYGSAALFTTVVPKVTFLARTKAKADQGLKAAIN